MQLYITEKPSVARALVDYFNRHGATFKQSEDKGYYIDTGSKTAVTWAVGHIMGLFQPEQYNPEWKHWNVNDLPIIPEGYRFKKYIKASLKGRYAAIKKLVETSTTIIHAGDPDREGQVLIDEILESIKKKPNAVKRLRLNALDDKSIKDALNSIEDNNLYEGLNKAGNMRNVIDWLIGINLTRFFTAVGRSGGFTTTFPVGRVKTPVLAMVVERELEIQNFKESTYFKVNPVLEIDGQSVPATMNHLTKFSTEEEARLVSDSIVKGLAIVDSIEKKEIVQEIKELHNLDTLQVEAAKVYGYSPKQTLALLQSLYEKKLTSYPRSDCKFLPEAQAADAPTILTNIKNTHILPVPIKDIPERVYNLPKPFNDKKITAHHAIIPTTLPIADVISTLKQEEKNIYQLICLKYASMFFKPHTYSQETILLTLNNDDEYTIKLSIKNITEEGWKALYRKQSSENEETTDDVSGTFNITEGASYLVEDAPVTMHKTKPPKRYNNGTIIQAMTNISSEDPELAKVLKNVKGIGTPATRADIIQDLTSSGLLAIQKKQLLPTHAGMELISIMPAEIKSAEYTALMELDLDKIQNGEITEFVLIQRIEGLIRHVIEQKPNLKIQDKSFECPLCHNGYLLLKQYRRKDNGELVRYYRCTNEECNQTFPAVPDQDIPEYVTCPTCHTGFIRELRSGAGKIFYGCSEFPKCKQTYPNRKAFDKIAKNNPFLHIKSPMEETFKKK